jgi:hypothetical protein
VEALKGAKARLCLVMGKPFSPRPFHPTARHKRVFVYEVDNEIMAMAEEHLRPMADQAD